jgi:hypothetical protein
MGFLRFLYDILQNTEAENIREQLVWHVCDIEMLVVLCQLQSNSRLFSKRVIFIPICHTVAIKPVRSEVLTY